MNNDDTSEANNLCDDLTAKLKHRNKLIKMADRPVLVETPLQSKKLIQSLATQTMERRSDKPRTGHLPKGKLKHLTKLPFAFPVRNHQASSFGSTMNITASHLRVNETSTSDFHRTILLRTAPISAHNGPVAQMSDWGKRALVVVKEGTGVNTAQTPDTETKIEDLEIDNEFSDLSNGYTIQEKGNNYTSVKGKLQKNLIFWRETLSANSAVLEITDNGYKIPFFKTPK